MKKILAIDDQQDNLTTLKAVIKTQMPDCIVLTALSGAEGIDIARKEQPDTILLDIIMPKMDGYEVCKLLKDDETTKHIPIIMITAIKTDIESRVKGLNLGADAFLSKPIDAVELTAQVKVMLRIKDAEDRLRTDKKGLKEIVKEQSFSLRESEEKYKALYENAPLPYQSLNEDGSFKDINPAWLTTLGYKKSEVIGKFYKDFLHPDWKDHFEKNYPAFKKRGYVSDVQFKIRHKDGHYLDISFEGCIGYYPDGSFRQTYCVFQDITERKLIEKTLQESETNYKNLFDQSPAGSVIVGLDKRFVKCNKAFCDFLGYNESELIGKTIAEITHPDDIEIGMAEMKQIVEGKIKTVSLEKRYLHKNGSSLWGQIVISIVRDTTNKPLYFLPIIEDITERKLVEIALKVSEEQYKYLFNSIRDAILVTDKDRNIIDCNTAFTKLFGYSKKEIVGRKTLYCYENEEQFIELGKALKENFTKSTPFLYTVNYKKKNQDVFPGETGVYYLKDNEGNVSGFIGLIRDVTERKLAEQKLIAAKEKTERNEIELIKAQKIAHLGSWYLDVETNEVVWTEELYKMYNFDPTQPVPPYIEHMKLFTPESWEILSTALAKTRETGIPYELELKTVKKEGTNGWMWVRGEVVKDKNEKIIGLWGAAQDITQRKQEEDELKKAKEKAEESELKYRSLIENTNDVVFCVDEKGEYKFTNQVFAKTFGKTPDFFVGKNFWDVYPKEEADHRFAAVKEMFRTGEVQTIEVSVPLPDRTLYYLAKANPIKDETGKVILNLTTAIDITERKQSELLLQEKTEEIATQNEELNAANLELIAAIKKAEESEKGLKHSYDLMQYIIEHNPSSVAVHDKDFKYLYVSHKYLDEYKVKEKNIIGKHHYDVFPDLPQKWRDVHKKVLAGEVISAEDDPYYKDDGTVEWTSWECRPWYEKDNSIGGFIVYTEVITKRKKMELELIAAKEKAEDSENLLNLFLQQSPVYTFIKEVTETQSRVIKASENFIDMIGISASQMLGKTMEELFPPEFAAKITADDWKVVTDGIVLRLDEDLGDRIYTTIKFPIVRHGKNLLAGYTIDITERKQAERAIEQSAALLKAIFESTGNGLLVVDNNGLATYKNDEFLNMWKIPTELRKSELDDKLLEAVLDQLVNPKQFLKKVKELYNSNKSGLDILDFKDGRIFERKSQPLIIEDKIAGRVWSFSDITERKRSEQIQKVLYNISDTVTSSDNIEELIAKIKDHLSGIIDTTNYYIGLYDEQTKMISLPFIADERDEIESFPAENSLTGHVIKTHKSLLVTFDQQEEMEKKGIIKFLGSRSQVWLGVPLIINGAVKGTLAVQSYTDKYAYTESDREILEFVSDQISLSIERKQKEQELISALEKATESDRLKSSFLATMSHELRTPLNAIIGFSDIIKEDLPIAEIIEFNQTINSSGNHLLTIVEDLFDITLIETGELKIIKEAVNIYSMLNEVNEIIKIEQLNLNKAHLELNLTIPDSQKQLRVNTDPWRLKQILINLLKNALKFTHKGSVKFGFTINMDSEPQVTERSRSTELKFFVKDTGIGIPKDKQELIFDVFRQIEDSHTRTYGGTGIGLSISRRLTELLGGRMWVDSDTNGSSFYFTIPLTTIVDQDKPGIKAELSSASIEDITILVVEDDESSFEYLKVVLKKTAQFILWAQNGEEAVKLCKNNSDIDLVLMDINMPVMNGYDAAKAIKEFRPNLPIIAQTAYAIAGDREKSLAAGCDEYISKPIRREDLLDKIKKLLSS